VGDLFSGVDRKEEMGAKKSSRIRLAVMDRWKAFRNSAARNTPQASILFDKFHVMKHLGEALDEVRKSEYSGFRAKTGPISRAYTLKSLEAKMEIRVYIEGRHKVVEGHTLTAFTAK
jgi:transposase